MYQHYIAVDWAQSNMAIAHLTGESNRASVRDVPASVEDLKEYLKSLRGSKILTIEETTTSQWLYVELHGLVDKIVICDPYKNKLLSLGAKNDKADAIKLVTLLKSDSLKAVFHSLDEIVKLRKLVSSYDDLIKRGVRLKNQRSAIFRSVGITSEDAMPSENETEHFVLQRIDSAIDAYEIDRKFYEQEFERLFKKFTMLRWLRQIPGIGLIGSVKIAAAVVDGTRFPDDRKFHTYCGLAMHALESGGRDYGRRKPRYRRDLKAVFKIAALSAITHDNEFTEYYRYLIREKRYPDHQARHAVARKIATAVYGVMKNKKKYDPDNIGALKHLRKRS
jgi:transposase